MLFLGSVFIHGKDVIYFNSNFFWNTFMMCPIYYIYIQGVPKKTPKCYKNKRRKSLLVLHVCARYKDYYIIIVGANMI